MITEIYWCLPAFLPVCPVMHTAAEHMQFIKPKQPLPSGRRMVTALLCPIKPLVQGQAGQALPTGCSKGAPELWGLLALPGGLWHLCIQSGYLPVQKQTVMC